jgi:hypothetical protein
MLNSEINTPEMHDRIYAAASLYDEFNHEGIYLNFEHGQWWVILSNGATYSVVDAVGGKSIDGFDFEQITPPVEE